MDKRQLIKLVSAFSMADGGLYKRKGRGNAYFAMNMLAVHDDYIEWVKTTLEHVSYVAKSKVKSPYKNPQTRLTSRVHPIFTKLHGRIYRGGYKSLDQHVVRHMDWEVMAIFYMADGGLYIEQPKASKGLVNPSPNVTLNMKRLSYGDTWFLKKCIKDRLGVEFNIGQQRYKGTTYYYLRLRNKDISRFMEGISPHITPSFKYKLYDSVRKAPMGERPRSDDEIV